MKQFIAFVRKEFFHIFRDRRTMLILLGMPVVQIILFGFAITTEVKNVRVAILDPSNDVVTRRIIDRLDASEYFSVTTNLNTPDEVEKSFRRGDIDLAVIFSEQFANHVYTGDACVQLVADATDPNTATTQTGYAANIISSAGREMLPAGMQVSTIVPEVKLLYNPQMKSAYNFVPGGTDPNVDLCHDDFHIHCSGEGDGNDGDTVGFSGEAAIHYSCQGSSLLCAFVCQLDNDFAALGPCARCSRGG